MGADGDDWGIARPKLREMLLKTPELGVAQGSPVPAVENQQYRTIPLAQLRKRYRTSIDPSEHEIRRALPNAKRVPRRWNIPAFVEHAEAEKPEQYEAQHADHSAADSSAISSCLGERSIQPGCK